MPGLFGWLCCKERVINKSGLLVTFVADNAKVIPVVRQVSCFLINSSTIVKLNAIVLVGTKSEPKQMNSQNDVESGSFVGPLGNYSFLFNHRWTNGPY